LKLVAMAQSNNILSQLKEYGFSDNEIITAIRQASNPNDVSQILDIINTNQLANNKEEEAKKPSQEFTLPPGWQKYYNNDGKQYYINHNDGTTHWNIPEEAYWEECTTNDGKTYYQCHKDKTTHWKLPKGIKLSEIAKTKPIPMQSSTQIISNNKPIPNKPQHTTDEDYRLAYSLQFGAADDAKTENNYDHNQKQMKNDEKPKPIKDAAYWQKLAIKCGLKGDMTEYINEFMDSDEYKNASAQEQQMMRHKMQSMQQQMIMKEMQHQQNMHNNLMSTVQNSIDTTFVMGMNACETWGDNRYHYYLRRRNDNQYPYNNPY